jgi:RNA polymerase sigma-54 factor
MTPQLQQAIRLLQLSSIELQAEIQEAIETNPLLEIEENDGYDHDTDQQSDRTQTIESSTKDTSQLEHSDIPDELPTDSEWEDTFDHQPIGPSATNNHQLNDNGLERENEDESSHSLQQHLLWQMQLTPFNEIEQAIATIIIDAIEEDGYFKGNLEDVQQALGEDSDVELDEIEAVLHRIQRFDPVGVGSRDLRECLLIQLEQFVATMSLRI